MRFIKLFNIEFAEANQNWQNAIDNFCGLKSIPIMTIHKSKGLEYSVVYFVGLENSTFLDFKNQPEEDRCTFFVVLSRVKCSETFTFSNVRSGLKYPKQKNDAINESFELLQNSGIANVFYYFITIAFLSDHYIFLDIEVAPQQNYLFPQWLIFTYL